MPDITLTPAQRKVLIKDQAARRAFLFGPLCLWRNRIADFGCRVVHSQKRWAGVQVGLSHWTGYAGGGKQAGPRSVYYDPDFVKGDSRLDNYYREM